MPFELEIASHVVRPKILTRVHDQGIPAIGVETNSKQTARARIADNQLLPGAARQIPSDHLAGAIASREVLAIRRKGQ
jgi:hypothetical protein